MGPLEGVRVLEYARYPAAAYAGLLLRMLGADVTVLESQDGPRLEDLPPRQAGRSMLHAYVAAGKRRVTLDQLDADRLGQFNLIVHDDDMPGSIAGRVDAMPLPAAGRVRVRCSPYGATGRKSDWQACELTLFQAGGEGYLMPHGLPFEEHPERPPIGIGRYSAHYQGGIAAALGAVAALRHSRSTRKAEVIDLSIQDTELSLNYFTVSRYVEGVRESRRTRAFRFAGILKCLDGWVELAPLENKHWSGVQRLLGNPAELAAPEFSDLISRSANGDRINVYLRRWAGACSVADAVAQASEAGVPCGPYLSPADLVADAQLRHRGFFVSDGPDAGHHRLYPGPAWTFDRWARPKMGPASTVREGDDATT